LFVWFSSTSAADRRASTLVSIVNDGATLPWFASLVERNGSWQLGELDGLGRLDAQELLDWPPGIRAV
jgi:hypothetical protein